MVERAEVVIVGGGIAGLATAWHLGRLGRADVLLLERERRPGTQATGQNAAILKELEADPVAAELVRRTAAFLRKPPAEIWSEPLVDGRGLLLVADEASAVGLADALRAAPPALPFRLLSREELRELAPFYAEGAAAAAHFPEDGRIDVERLVLGLALGCERAGVRVRTGARVEAIRMRRGRAAGVRLAGGEEIAAGTTVVAAGGWAGGLGRAAGSRLALRPTRRHLLVSRAERGVRSGWPVVWTQDESFYFRPERGGLLLCACDETDVDPDRCEVDPLVRERILARARAALPGLVAGAAELWCGMRTFARDRRPVVGPDADVPGLFWVAGLGGQGMGTGIEIGRVAAALLAGEDAGDALAEALSPARAVRGPA